MIEACNGKSTSLRYLEEKKTSDRHQAGTSITSARRRLFAPLDLPQYMGRVSPQKGLCRDMISKLNLNEGLHI